MPRLRELGFYSGELAPGVNNAITDVPGVLVGHVTLIRGQGERVPGIGPLRTGVTLVRPHGGNLYAEKVPAAVYTINGFGKVTGFEQVRELGTLETAIALTGTLNVPRVADALLTLAIEENPHIGVGFPESGYSGYPSANPLVGETSDGYLSELQARPVGLAEVRAAFKSASSGQVPEGSVGAGTGTSCYGWKGGIGTASRVLSNAQGGFTLGALVQSNFGQPAELMIAGVPVGRHLRPPDSGVIPLPKDEPGGSIMIVLATDAPLDACQLERLCKRASFGLARTGSTCHAGSGDFVVAFSTAWRIPDRPEQLVVPRQTLANEQVVFSRLSLAVIEAVEEAIYNSLLMAETITGRDGHVRHALPAADVLDLFRRYGRLIK